MFFYLVKSITTFVQLIFNVINKTVLLILLNDYFQRKFPDEYKNFLINISYKFINLTSKMQMFYYNYKNNINVWIESHENIKNTISYIQNKYAKKTDDNIDIIEFKYNGTHATINIKKYVSIWIFCF